MVVAAEYILLFLLLRLHASHTYFVLKVIDWKHTIWFLRFFKAATQAVIKIERDIFHLSNLQSI